VATVVAATLVVVCLSAAPAPASASGAVAAESAAATARVVVAGTDAADIIQVAQLGDGSLSVRVNGAETVVPQASAASLVIDARAGDDVVSADASLAQGIVVLAGSGADTVSCGPGADSIDGGPGRDALDGGAGADVIYGGPGADQILGGEGADYLDGGDGDDIVSGGPGDDILIGGRGDDSLAGDDGDDVLAGGPGTDAYDGGAGAQRTFAQRSDRRPLVAAGGVTWVALGGVNAAGEAVGSSLSFARTGAFSQRLRSDVQALLSLPIGRRLLLALDAAGRRVGVVRSTSGNRTTIRDSAAAFLRLTGRRGPGSASTVAYDPLGSITGDGTEAWMHRPPVIGLYHELVHSLNAATGSLQPRRTAAGVPKLELQAIGLPFAGIPWDHDGKASTPRRPGNLRAFTENGFRSFLGLAERTRY
jgi:Ca2+-binding RTX toxin-like protein